MNRTQKEIEMKNLSTSFAAAKALVFTSYRGLKVEEMNEVRSELRKGGSKLKVIKNRIAKKALDEQGLSELHACISGPTAVASSETDAVVSAKIMVEMAKKYEAIQIFGGALEGKLISVDDIIALSKLPSREVLIAKVLGSMSAPAQNMVGVLAALPRQLVTVIDAIAKTKS
ncbi:MAG: 50S ribosomal protein L10 [Deltaproteobacteria bacterium CG_4_10_14_0_2_um_filter_43_8]|nr:MAG: 50S ribosomal protein L10 [Deltaproteobacteria bacterium CG11_big_fil_rev_8_21_14_0_20_42_23]PJA20733.1 MAG: 50S ribosomal protein L10 [Deltaproteobacteria bacterium CG_4_10_14_0_2_um_filter_43_8]PJC63955.1 MAG: 50S ribosomal protein L10 [Deltaproteobacteria bacterium CG_4_9_14_0_2_um_filter_42_21]